MFREDLREAPDFVEGVVKRDRRDADHIRLTEISLHPRDLEFCEKLFRMFVHEDGELRAALVRLARRDDGEKLRRRDRKSTRLNSSNG